MLLRRVAGPYAKSPANLPGVWSEGLEGLSLMMTQEEFMDVVALHRQGWTITDIAAAVGRHPQTVSAWIKAGGPPARREAAQTLLGDRWGQRVAELLGQNERLLATSLFRLLAAEGCPASYPTVTRHLRQVRGVRRGARPAVTVAIETPPGQEVQADWTELSAADVAALGLSGPVFGFGAVLCWSRWRFVWFADSLDFGHTAHGLIQAFADAGGVPAVVRIDNMGALVSRSHPNLVLRPVARTLANHYGFSVAGCWPGDGARKGKVERPFRELKESFVQEMALRPPGSIGELNRRVGPWLDAVVHARAHRVTGEPPADRRRREAGLLGPLPRLGFDTARREPRRVPRTCLVEVDGAGYSVPPGLVGQLVEVRLPTVADRAGQRVQIRSAGQLIVEHARVPAGQESWDGAHRAAVEHLAVTRHWRQGRRHLHAVDVDVTEVPSSAPGRTLGSEPGDGLGLGPGDFDVAPVDLAARLGLSDDAPARDAGAPA